MSSVALVYPHQLFAENLAVQGVDHVILVEDPLFFKQFSFHRQKLILHRASMQKYAARLRATGKIVQTIEASGLNHSRDIAAHLARQGFQHAQMVEPCDDWLSRRISNGLAEHGVALTVLPDPSFLTPEPIIQEFDLQNKRLFFTKFYIDQRKRLGILLEEDGTPTGGTWSFDQENRKRLPSHVVPPYIHPSQENSYVIEARNYVAQNFPDSIGLDIDFRYPIDSEAATEWLEAFISERLAGFGDYEDAISKEHDFLFHSLLTPMLNIGLLTPQQVVDAALLQADSIPMNSLEGFLRQVIGWREFMRLGYLTRGREMRTRNFWGFTRRIPASFYNGTTGIEPVDTVIRRVLRHGYCHHIERLMILGNFMLLCEFDPNEVYRWFMELFIDSYDWVMVPNVYAMSQYADGGGITTKPYLSGSNYVLKMSDFRKGEWCSTWDALYWRFVSRNQEFFSRNPRLAQTAHLARRMGDKMEHHLRVADEYLASLDRS